MSECACGKPTRDAAYVCDDCLDDLSKALGNVTWVEEQLEITITKQHAAISTDGSRSNEKPLPFHSAAVEKRDALRNALVTWIRHCIEDGVRSSDPGKALPDNDLVSMSRWLLWRVDGLGLNDLGYEAVDQITSAVAHCERVIDRPPERRYAGPCSECKRDLYHRPGATEATCSGCGLKFNIAELHAWMVDQVRDQLVTAREGATLLCKFEIETKQATVDKWHERGLLVEHGKNQAGHRVYAFDDLLTLATRHQKAS